MSGHSFRPSIARVQNAQKVFTSAKTNATIRDLEEEEGELEEKEGTVVSIKRDSINGSGWTVKDKEGNTYICSCASSMYEVPETVERGGVLYPKETIEVVFTVNPVLRINTIKEIKKEFEKMHMDTRYLEPSYDNDTPMSVIIIDKSTKKHTIYNISDKYIGLKKCDFDFTPDLIFVDGYDAVQAKNLLERYPKSLSVLDASLITSSVLELVKKTKYRW